MTTETSKYNRKQLTRDNSTGSATSNSKPQQGITQIMTLPLIQANFI